MIINKPQEELHTQCFWVPNAAVDSFCGEGSPVYLMIYLYALRQYHAGNMSVSNSQIAEVLHVSEIDVVNAFLFYGSRGLLKIHHFTSVDDTDFDIEFCFEPAKTGKTEFRPSYKAAEISRQLTNNPKVSQMYHMVGQILGKVLSTADAELLYSLYDYYALSPEVILVLVEYFASKGKRSMRAIEKEAAKWVSSGVDTVEKARAYIRKREEFLSYASQVRRTVGVGERRLTTKELEYINLWQNKFQMDLEMIKAAFERTVDQTGKLSFAYMNRILESWAESDIHKPEEIQKEKKKTAKKAKNQSEYNFEELEKSAFRKVMEGGASGV